MPAGKRTPWWSRELAAKKMSFVKLRRRFHRSRRSDEESFGQLKVEVQRHDSSCERKPVKRRTLGVGCIGNADVALRWRTLRLFKWARR